MSSPGPGSYLNQHNASTFGKSMQRTGHYSNFGSSVDRFKGSNMININGMNLGPGQYNIDSNPNNQRNRKFQTAGSASFKGPRRNNHMINQSQEEAPGPGEYMIDKPDQIQKQKQYGKQSTAFASNIQRFKKQPQWVPPPGTYNTAKAYNLRSHSSNYACFKSNTKRELKLITDKGKHRYLHVIVTLGHLQKCLGLGNTT